MTDPISLQDIAAIVASVPKGADRATLTGAIDKAVDGVIGNLQATATALPPDLLKITKFTLEFLEACGKMGDPSFRTHIKARASELHNELSIAAAKAAAAAPKTPAVDPNAKTYASFEPAFADYFCEFIGLRLRAFQIDTDPPPFAYVLNKNFETVFLDTVRAQILPEILKGRRIRNMADSVVVTDLTRNFFFEEFLKDPTENPTHMLWTGLMDDFRLALVPPPEPKKKDAKGIAGMFAKKAAAPAPKKTATGDRFAMAEKFLKALQKGAQDHGFDPPRVEDFRFFRALMDYKMGDIEANKKALGQLLAQENLEDEDLKAREGATRDWLYRTVERLPPHCGELLALWAYHSHGELFSQQMLRSFMMGQGTTEKARERAVPMFSRWMKEFIDAPAPAPAADD